MNTEEIEFNVGTHRESPESNESAFEDTEE